MLVWALVSWWYTAGWAGLAGRVEQRFARTLDSFSVGLLLQTLFNPYRQISATGVRGPIGVQLRAAFDKLFSRLIGFVVRTIVILTGLLVALLALLVGLVQLVLWPIVPLVPIVAIVATVGRWLL